MAALEQARWRAFVNRVYQGVRESFRERAASEDPEVLRKEVNHALARGRQHGFESEHDLVRYTWLCFALGRDFDRDEKHRWAGEILESHAFAHRTKVDLLMQIALSRLGYPQSNGGPVEYEEAEEDVALEETPDEERLPLDEDEVADFEPESEDPGELPEDIIVITNDDGIDFPDGEGGEE